MEQFLQYITELNMQLVFVIEKELEALGELDLERFEELQGIESQLLVLLHDSCSVVKKDASVIYGGDYDTIAKLSKACIRFEKCLITKHNAIEILQNVHGRISLCKQDHMCS